MGLFSQIFGSNRPDGLFRSEMQHLTNRVDQIGRNIDRIQEVRATGVSESDLRILIVSFITDTEAKAKKLVSELALLGYESDWEAPEQRNDYCLITGRAVDILMTEVSIAEWTNLMCDLAAAQDCAFSGWEL